MSDLGAIAIGLVLGWAAGRRQSVAARFLLAVAAALAAGGETLLLATPAAAIAAAGAVALGLVSSALCDAVLRSTLNRGSHT